jgi:SAM-dependent methyltransferase
VSDPSLKVHRDEAEFHDRWAESEAAEGIQVREAFEAPTALENRFILGLLGSLEGQRVLDVGSGLGESSIYFALQGADVTALDISPKMVELCVENAKRYGVEVTGVVSTGEDLDLPADSFDVVYVANAIHHITDRDRFLGGVRKVLKPGGLFVAWDPVKYSPVINIYRRMATDVRTPDEQPLGVADIRMSRRHFPDVQHRQFWLLTQALFLKYFLFNRRNPNEVRYWKRILQETPESLGWWWRAAERIDRVLLRIPLLRWMAWNVVQWGRKPAD